MSGAVIGTKKCSRCGGTMRYTESKTGAISGVCDTCNRQSFDRGPKAVEGIKRQLAGSGKPAEQPAAGAAGNGGEAFDITKL